MQPIDPGAMLRIDAIKSRRVRGHDVVTRRRGQNLKRVLDLLDHAGIGAVKVRKVGSPQDIAVEPKRVIPIAAKYGDNIASRNSRR